MSTESIVQLGALGVLVMVLSGLGIGAKLAAPAVKEFLLTLIADLRASTAALIRIETKIDAIPTSQSKAIEAAVERLRSELASSASGTRAAVREQAAATGQHAAQTAETAALIALQRVSSADQEEMGRRPSPSTPMRSYTPTGAAASPSSARSSAILIVEDDRSGARMLQILLRKSLHVEATIAHSCEEAHRLLLPPAMLPKVAIIDYHLGRNDDGIEENGVDLAKKMPRGIAIVLVSGVIDRRALERRAQGIHALWFEKPITGERATALVSEVRKHLERNESMPPSSE